MEKIRNICLEKLRLPKACDAPQGLDSLIHEKLSGEGEPLRWAVVRARPSATGTIVDVEATLLHSDESLPRNFSHEIIGETLLPNGPVFLHIVPTGIQASVGGSLGDAMPANLALGSLGLVVTHPNTCNGGALNVMDPSRILYVEGGGLDRLAREEIVLERVKSNKVGVAVDCGPGDEWVLDQVWNAVWGFWAHSGASIVGLEETREPVGGVAKRNKSGAFIGEVKNIEALFHAGERLIDRGAEALAVFTFVDVSQSHWKQYFKDKAPNPVGGTEAIISHSLVRHFGIPAAHAPLLRRRETRELQKYGRVRPAAGLEAADPFYVWSVLRGLQFAPRFVSESAEDGSNFLLSFRKVSALVCPASAMGGIPMMRAEALGIPILGIRQSETVLQVRASDLGYKNAIELDSYLDAVGLLELIKSGGDEFKIKPMRELIRKFGKEVYAHGEEVCRDAGLDPQTLLRPLVAPE